MNKYPSVELPERTRILNKNNKKYVYYSISSEYQKGKKYSIDKRVLIGKIDPNNPKKMIPNAKYFEIFASDEKLDDLQDDQFNFAQNFGHFILFEKVVQDLGLDQVLKEVFKDNTDIIKALSYYFLTNQSLIIEDFEKWTFNNYCGLKSTPSQTVILKLLNKYINGQTIFDFNVKWVKHIQQLFKDVKKVFVNFDEHNYSIEGNGSIINVVYLNDQHYGLPLFYKTYLNFVSSQTKWFIMGEEAYNLGFKDVSFVIDKSNGTSESINLMDEIKQKFICITQTHTKTIKDLVEKHKNDIQQNAFNYIDDFDVYGIKSKEKVYDDIDKKFNTYIFYSLEKANEEINSFKNIAKLLKENFLNIEKVNDSILWASEEYLTIKYNKRTKHIQGININKEKLQEVIDQSGYFVIISNTDLTIEEVLEMYGIKNNIDKIFNKVNQDSDIYETHLIDTTIINSNIFIGFISAIISSFIYFKTKKLRSYDPDITLSTIIDELNKYIVLNENGKLKRKYKITTKQEEFFNCFEIDEDYILSFINKLNDC
ncbi:hypothetical protein GE118_01475 [Mycoplasma sp. NEAQ87857]|uniref:IS1634 family transposase n=1 Tax=Mycoplasma sp. NEAQ87857 TaxID=2683967 RepID=UPI001315FCF3|nr:hypothetical protein [Mycoplasma sp. NEAQ87857]QGZ97465.1 hypothetical protein GE118_01475 [Mycoplasma sp. NEAQ87857]